MHELTIATRSWAHVLPLALGDVPGNTAGISLQRRDVTPDLWSEPGLAAAETSFSSYVRARAAGNDTVTAVPYFIMRSFRHRCIIVSKQSSFESPESLQGATIGLTGWPDSGNTWTRAVLRDHGVELDQVRWRVGRLTAAHPDTDRFGGVTVGQDLDVQPVSEPLLDSLEDGRLDAVMTPFMPKSFFEESSPFRTLFPDTYAEEAVYFSQRGYIPGIHLIGVRTELLAQEPHLAQELERLFAESEVISHRDRAKLQDVTPWTDQALHKSVQAVGHTFNPVGLQANRSMIKDFQLQLCAQQLMSAPLPLHDLFPYSS